MCGSRVLVSGCYIVGDDPLVVLICLSFPRNVFASLKNEPPSRSRTCSIRWSQNWTRYFSPSRKSPIVLIFLLMASSNIKPSCNATWRSCTSPLLSSSSLSSSSSSSPSSLSPPSAPGGVLLISATFWGAERSSPGGFQRGWLHIGAVHWHLISRQNSGETGWMAWTDVCREEPVEDHCGTGTDPLLYIWLINLIDRYCYRCFQGFLPTPLELRSPQWELLITASICK